MEEYEWAVVGSGIAGVVAAEILTREGHSVILIEKNSKLASETTRDFHEWMHTGSLYTLIPDNLKTLKFILGAVDDLFDFYSSYKRMNLRPTIKGIDINGDQKGWFNANNFIHFKFRVKGRKFTFPWLIGIARSVFLINKIKEHDWLRRRGGVIDSFKYNWKDLVLIIRKLIISKERFYSVETPDFTMNSRLLLNDLISTSKDKGLTISLKNSFISYKKTDGGFIVETEDRTIFVQRIALCNGANVADFVKAKVKKSYAPMAIIGDLTNDTKSFVELDYYPKNCINIIVKENEIGLIGGISFNDESKCADYIDEVISKHKQYQPQIKVLGKYNGVKNEITLPGESRNYLYHIKEVEEDVWLIVPGKFTLGFSIGPEFYRRVYKKNPRKFFDTTTSNSKSENSMSNPVWKDMFNKFNSKNK